MNDFTKPIESLEHQLSYIQPRASSQILHPVTVECYESSQKLQTLCKFVQESANCIIVVPFDPSSSKDIVYAIEKANLGVSVSQDSKGIRISFPIVTQERRKELCKLVNKHREQAKVALRAVRAKHRKVVDSSDSPDSVKDSLKLKIETATKANIDVIDSLCEVKIAELMKV